MSRAKSVPHPAASFHAVRPSSPRSALPWRRASARAQDAATFPDHPVRVIVSTAAGGGVDAFARIVTQKMGTDLGQPFPVENRAGAGGSVGADAVFHSTPDGYTLLASQPAPITTNGLLLKGLDYDPAQLEAVAIMSHIPNVLLVRPDFPAKTVQELIAYAKQNPGKLNYASQGPGTTSHLTAALFESITHTKLVHVPYKGTGPALNDLIASHVDLMFTELATSLELHKSGRARILAVATKQRVAAVPDIPTLDEVRRDGLRIRHLECADRSAKNAGSDHRQAECCRQQSHAGARSARALSKTQRHPGRRDAGRDSSLHQGRNATLGRSDSHRRHPAGMTTRNDVPITANKRLMHSNKGVDLDKAPRPTLIHVLRTITNGTQSTATAIQMFTVEVGAPATTMEGSAGS